MKADAQRSRSLHIPARRITFLKTLFTFFIFAPLTPFTSFAQSTAPAAAPVKAQAPAQSSPQAPSKSPSPEGMSLEQFRAAVAAHAVEGTPPKSREPKSGEKLPPPDLRSPDELFLQLLLAQANDAAIRQSLDRLSGWRKSIESRFQTQTVPELDVDTIKFAEAKRTAEAARADVELKRLVEQANAMLGHPSGSSLQALLPASGGGDDPASALEKQQKDLLGQGEELIVKQFKNYQYGGITLGVLLWQEQQVYQTELEYRAGVAHDAVPAAAGKAAGSR